MATKVEFGYIRIILVRVQKGVDLSVHPCGAFHHRLKLPLSLRLLRTEEHDHYSQTGE